MKHRCAYVAIAIFLTTHICVASAHADASLTPRFLPMEGAKTYMRPVEKPTGMPPRFIPLQGAPVYKLLPRTRPVDAENNADFSQAEATLKAAAVAPQEAPAQPVNLIMPAPNASGEAKPMSAEQAASLLSLYGQQ